MFSLVTAGVSDNAWTTFGIESYYTNVSVVCE